MCRKKQMVEGWRQFTNKKKEGKGKKLKKKLYDIKIVVITKVKRMTNVKKCLIGKKKITT